MITVITVIELESSRMIYQGAWKLPPSCEVFVKSFDKFKLITDFRELYWTPMELAMTKVIKNARPGDTPYCSFNYEGAFTFHITVFLD